MHLGSTEEEQSSRPFPSKSVNLGLKHDLQLYMDYSNWIECTFFCGKLVILSLLVQINFVSREWEISLQAWFGVSLKF